MNESNEISRTDDKVPMVEQAFRFYCTPIFNRWPTYVDVAKKYNVSTNAVERWGSMNDWVKRRANMGKKATEEFFAEREKIIRETERKHFENLDDLESGVVTAIRMLIDNQNKVLHDPDLTVDEKIKLMKQIRSQSMDFRNLADALKNAQNQKRVILGIPTEISKADIHQTNKEETLSPEDAAAMTAFIKKNSPKPTEAKETPENGHSSDN